MTLVPLSALELRDAVRNWRAYDPQRLNRILNVDERAGLVEVQANTSWRAIADQLRPGDPRAATARTTMPTVGASIAANAAGPDGRPAVVHVESLTLVAPDGELRRISRHANRELFALVVGGQGLFGVLYSVTLRIDTMSDSIARPLASERLVAPGAGRAQTLALLVPPEKTTACIDALRSRCEEWRTSLDGLEVRRVLDDTETFLQWAPREYAELSVRLGEPASLGGAVRAAQLARDLIDVAIAHGGSFAIATTPQASRAQAEVCYPRLKSFLAEKRRLDPAERWVNPWYQRYRPLLLRESVTVRWAS